MFAAVESLRIRQNTVLVLAVIHSIKMPFEEFFT